MTMIGMADFGVCRRKGCRFMRITFVLPCFELSGGNRVLSIYAERLQRRGHQVLAVAPRHPRPTLREIARSLIKRRAWPTRWDKSPSHFDGLSVERRLLNHPAPVTDADVPEADLVIASWWETAEWVWALSSSRGVKVHFMQDYELWGGQKERVDATCRLPIPKIVIAGWVRDLLLEQFQQRPLALIPNGVDTERFHAPPRGKQAVPTVGTVYTPFRNKGCDIVLQAYERAAREVANLKLVSMGSTPLADTLPLPAGAEFTYRAADDKLKDIYARCDAWLFGTRIEGFGLPILEAMACRTPVIGTPAGAAPELLCQGGGILVPHENPQEMAQAIVRVCRMSEAEWRQLSDAALATAAASTWEDSANRFEQALLQAAGR